MQPILLSNALILTMLGDELDPNSIKKGWVATLNNRVAMVTYKQSDASMFITQHPDTKIIECSGCLVMPGLINTHTHVSMTLMRNFSDDLELMEWLQSKIWPFEALQSSDDIKAGTRLGVAEMLLGGTTSFLDMYWDEWAIAQAVEELGARALLTECFVDSSVESSIANMDRLREWLDEWGSGRVECGVGPHAPYTLSVESLARVSEYAKRHNLPATIHLAETRSERDIVTSMSGMSPLERVEAAGLLNDRTTLAHSIYLNDEEMVRIGESGGSIAHSPQSNMKLSSGVAQVASLARAGVNTTLSTDGASSNNDLDMWEEMRSALFISRVAGGEGGSLAASDVLRMATINGAKAMGHEGDLGVIREGSLADIIVVDLTRPHLRPRNNIISALVYCAKARDVRDVIVDGVLRVEGGELLGVDIEKLASEAEESSKRVASKM